VSSRCIPERARRFSARWTRSLCEQATCCLKNRMPILLNFGQPPVVDGHHKIHNSSYVVSACSAGLQKHNHSASSRALPEGVFLYRNSFLLDDMGSCFRRQNPLCFLNEIHIRFEHCLQLESWLFMFHERGSRHMACPLRNITCPTCLQEYERSGLDPRHLKAVFYLEGTTREAFRTEPSLASSACRLAETKSRLGSKNG
jgi:hypothetical protein